MRNTDKIKTRKKQTSNCSRPFSGDTRPTEKCTVVGCRDDFWVQVLSRNHVCIILILFIVLCLLFRNRFGGPVQLLRFPPLKISYYADLTVPKIISLGQNAWNHFPCGLRPLTIISHHFPRPGMVHTLVRLGREVSKWGRFSSLI